jgi:hypothetical protein
MYFVAIIGRMLFGLISPLPVGSGDGVRPELVILLLIGVVAAEETEPVDEMEVFARESEFLSEYI